MRHGTAAWGLSSRRRPFPSLSVGLCVALWAAVIKLLVGSDGVAFCRRRVHRDRFDLDVDVGAVQDTANDLPYRPSRFSSCGLRPESCQFAFFSHVEPIFGDSASPTCFCVVGSLYVSDLSIRRLWRGWLPALWGPQGAASCGSLVRLVRRGRLCSSTVPRLQKSCTSRFGRSSLTLRRRGRCRWRPAQR